MYKNFLFIAFGTLLFSGCGGGGDGDNLDGIKSKKYVFVYHNIQSGICESSVYLSGLNNGGFRNMLTKEKDNSTTCASLGRANNTNTCVEYYFNVNDTGYGDTSCLLGFQENIDAGLY